MSARQAFRESLRLLTPRDRRKLIAVTGVQMATSLLDLVGVLLLGLVGALAVTAVQNVPPPPAVATVADTLGLGTLSSMQLLATFASLAAGVLLFKSLVSTLLLRRVFLFLARRQAEVSGRLAQSLMSRSLSFVRKRSSQTTAYALVQGAGSATLVTLGQGVVFISEIALLAVLGAFLLAVNPTVAVASIVFFGLVAFALQLSLGRWAMTAGVRLADLDIASLDAVQEGLAAYREISVLHRRDLYVQRFQGIRRRAARYAADLQFISSFPKYIFEVALVIGGFALAAFLILSEEVVEAVGTLALFLAAASRVMPSLLRLQGATLTMRNAAGFAALTMELATELDDESSDGPNQRSHEPKPGAPSLARSGREGSEEFSPTVELQAVSFSYPDSRAPAIRSATLSVPAGSSMAFVGASGAGKSTLADLVLGLLEPQGGTVRLGAIAPGEAVRRWPGAIAYVPQDVALANDTLRANVALGLPREATEDEMVWDALRRAHLTQLVLEAPEGLDLVIGEKGTRLSGGQRQRLGIARALYTQPRLLVLDEATSALDAETELAVAETIGALEGRVTRIIIAHRLSTVRAVDQLIFLEKGAVVAQGTFDEVRRTVKTFDRQAAIMGLG